MQHVNISEYMSRRAAALGIDTQGLIRSEEEMQAMMQQQQMASMAEKAAPNMVNAAARQMEQEP